MVKTIKEAAQEYANRTDKANAEWVMTDFLAGVEFAQRWIPVSEELPEDERLILVKDKEDNISTASYCGNFKFIIDFDDVSETKVTHWRHI